MTTKQWHAQLSKGALADLLIDRLNEILKTDPVALNALVSHRVPCNDELAKHSTVQVHDDGINPTTVGLLGVLNGLVGAIEDGPRKGWGFITGVSEADGSLSHFQRTK